MASVLKCLPLASRRSFPSAATEIRLIRPAAAPASECRFKPSSTKPLSTSIPAAWPHFYTTSTSQQNKVTHKEESARPINEIPTIKSKFLFQIAKDPARIVDSMEMITHELGHIFRLSAGPRSHFLFVVEPKDVEKVIRVGDLGYPERLPIYEWKQVRKELKVPPGLFQE